MKNTLFGIAVMVAILGVVFAASPAAAGSHDHSRTGFFIGLGVGWGNAGTEVALFDDVDRENSGAANFRLGWAVSEKVTIGLESSSWVKEYDIGTTGADLKLTGTVNTLAVTFFPENMGLYFRGGLGFATASAEIQSGSLSFEDTEVGLGLLGAVGYEWRLTRMFALGPQVQWAYLSIDGDGTESVDFVSITAQATWYW